MAQLISWENFAVFRPKIAISYDFFSATSGGRPREMCKNELCNRKERFESLRLSSTLAGTLDGEWFGGGDDVARPLQISEVWCPGMYVP